MEKVLFTIVFMLLSSLSVFAQEYEYGKPAELKGLTKVFIDTEADVTNFNRIKEVLDKAKLPDLTVVGKLDDADFVIMFRGDTEKVQVGNATKKQAVGKGLVGIPSSDGKKLRVLMNFESTQDKAGEKKPATKFAKEFVKAYKTANDIK